MRVFPAIRCPGETRADTPGLVDHQKLPPKAAWRSKSFLKLEAKHFPSTQKLRRNNCVFFLCFSFLVQFFSLLFIIVGVPWPIGYMYMYEYNFSQQLFGRAFVLTKKTF